MNFELSDDQKLLVDTVQSFARKDSPTTRFRELRATEEGFDRGVWRQMGELGWLGVMFPEAVGGAGLGVQEATLVLEQLGATLVPEPYLESVLLAGTALLHAGSDAQQQRWLAPMVAGETVLTLAHTERQARFDAFDVSTRAERRADGSWLLTGEKTLVPVGHAADALIVSARTNGAQRDLDGISLFVVEPSATGLERQRLEFMDGHKGATLRLRDVIVPPDALLGEAGQGWKSLELALDHGAAGTCAEGAGLLRAVLEMTRHYLTERKQFGAPIGSFQALQHRCVDMFVEVELAKSTAILAMIKASAADVGERQRALSAAKVTLATSGGFVVRQAIQLHGGIGVTDEHDVGLYFKRHHTLSTLCGDEQYHVERFARLPGFAPLD